MDQVQEFADPDRAPDPRALLHALFDAAPEAVIVLDEAGVIVGWNPAAATVFGWSAAEAAGRSFDDLVVAETDRASWRGQTDCSVLRRDGSPFPAELTVTEALEAERRFDVVRVRDITAARDIERESNRTRSQFQAFVDNAPVAMTASTPRGRFVLFNRKSAEPYGRTPEEMFTLDGATLAAQWPNFAADVMGASRRVLETGEPHTVEAEIFSNPHGEVRKLQHTMFPVFEESNGERRISVVGAIAVDITEFIRAQQAQQNLTARLTQFLDHAPMAVTLADREGRLLTVNQAAAGLLGAPAEALVGRSLSDLPLLRPPGEGSPASLIEDIRSGKIVRFATKVAAPDADTGDGGDWRILDLTFFPIRNDEGDTTEIGNFAIDVTQIRRAQDRLAAQQTALHQSEKLAALGQLLAGVAHELNNPLTVVVGRSAILEEKLAGTAHEKAIMGLREAADRCNRIVKTFLAMARQSEPRRGPAQLNAMVQAALDMTAYAMRTAGIQVDLALDPALPEVEADEDQLVQVCTNLLLNAQHALEQHPGPRSVRISTHAAGDRVLLAIADSGPGVPPELESRIFEPFFTTKEVGKGTGMGLAMARGTIEEHGGALSWRPTPAGGATFEISLPVAGPSPAPASGDLASDRGGAPE